MSVGLYIHIPFCVRKCSYCDFVSFAGRENRIDEYMGALFKELKTYSGADIDTVFVGGGTPSVLGAERIAELCAAVRETFTISDDCEWTMEVNPGTLSEDKLRAMRDGGINRVSIGVQSFNDAELRAAGRIHTAEQAKNAVCAVSNAGFENISIDLMASLPLQTEESFAKSLKTAVALPVKHMSVYSLIIEDGTPLAKEYADGVYSEPDEDTDRRMYRFTRDFLAAHGIYRYEVSNYAMSGFESRHNLRYWNCDEYIGAGLAAHSYMKGRRYRNTEDLNAYIGGSRRAGKTEMLSPRDMESEFMILGLRKTEGISAAEFYRRFKETPDDVYGGILDKYVKLGLLEKDGDIYRFTDYGTDVENTVLCQFI